TLYRGWMKIFKSADLGKTWTQITNWYNNNYHDEVHADHFRIKKNPLIDDRLYFCNDGGVYIYEESDNNWIERSAGLIISQYYCISSSQADPVVLLAGSQDNGGWYRNNNAYWRTTNGGDAMHTWQHPTNNSVGISSYPGGKIYKTTNAWTSYSSLHTNIEPLPGNGDWNSRYALDPNNHNIIVTGCYPDIYRSDDMGGSWQKIAENLAGGKNFHCVVIPESNSGYIYASAENRIYKTMDTGASWQSSVPSYNKIRGIAVSPYNADHLWVVTGGFNDGEKVFRSYDGGKSWENISGSLPNLPALSIIYEKGTNDGIYIGMTYGIYYRNNTMNDWVFYGHGIPNCEIRHLDIQYATGKIRCATYGRGIYEADLYPLDADRPEAYFEISSKSICLKDSITFLNKSVNAERIIWDLGDGSTGTSDTINHVYSSPGIYTAKLTAFNALRADVHQEEDIRIKAYVDPVRLGPRDQSMGSKDFHKGEGEGIIFNAGFPLILKSFVTIAATKGSRTLKLIDSNGNTVFSSKIYLRAGSNYVPLDLAVKQGNDYILKFEGNTDLIMNTYGASYPYNKYDLFSITGNTGFNPDRYYYFYDMVVQYMSCDPADLPAVHKSTNVAVDDILVYPNPVKDEFFIEIRGFQPEEELTIRIINLSGDILYRENISRRRMIQMHKNDLGVAGGVYILEVSGTATRRLSHIIRM
ncbi:MAG: PKD domain-containing protein, partial [Bacteroidales bacterium]|nr:PKD domain-containing protein [Bacteroidales bacterium]